MMMINRKGRGTKQRVIVVLEGIKSFLESSKGVAPLSKAIHDVVGPEDQLLILTLLYWNDHIAAASPPPRPILTTSVFDAQAAAGALDPNMDFLYQEIIQRKEAYARVFKPFYLSCQSYGVKFEVKIAAGYRPKDIVIEEAKYAKANWIVMDSCFAGDVPSFQLGGTRCNVISVNDDGEAIFHSRVSNETSSPQAMNIAMNKAKSHSNPNNKHYSTLAIAKEPKYLGKKLCCVLPPISEPSSPCSSTNFAQNDHAKEKLKMVEPQMMIRGSPSSTISVSPNSANSSAHSEVSPRKFCDDPNFVLGLPLKLSREEIEEITLEFSNRISSDESQHFVVFDGFMALCRSRVLVKMFRGGSGGVFLKAEKKAALSMSHKNIMRLIGYCQSDDTTFLVFPFAERGTLDMNLSGLLGKEFKLTFQDKLKIAIGIGQGLRYMHEECPRGPIVHGKILLSNVFLGDDLRPQISGFGRATWLHLKHAWPIYAERYSSSEDRLEHHELMAQIKSDVLSFGVLLLRLFCGRTVVPQDDETLIKWARPLLLERAFHILLDKDDDEAEDLDMHEMFRVMFTAFQCVMTRPENRPNMSEVISYLKGESFCVMQSSP